MTSTKERIIALADGTRTSREIAEALGLAMNTVRTHCRQMELPLLRAIAAPNGTVHEWTEDDIATLRKRWGEGRSISQIGRELGVSRNAIAGKVKRLGLSKRASPIRPGSPKPGRTPVLPKPTPTERAVAHNGPGIPLVERKTSECGWIIGEPRDFRCCGAPTIPGRDWCESHASKVYRQSNDIPRGLRLPGEKKRRAA